MDKAPQYLISKNNDSLQISYEDYIVLMEKAEEARRIRATRDEVLAALEAFLNGHSATAAETAKHDATAGSTASATEPLKGGESRKSAETIEATSPPAAKPVAAEESAELKARLNPSNIEAPPIKDDIAEHFNRLDESGRLLNVFRQYYACLNDSCGSTVRVTMKDGICSLWNYDEWEEFAVVDIFKGNLRFGVDSCYAADLSPLNLCEVPLLLSRRRNLVCVQVDDLNTTMLDILAKAFKEVGLAASQEEAKHER
jgi:hypothetical protein